MQHKYITSLRIQHADGSFEAVNPGTVSLAAGANMGLVASSEGITIASGTGLKTPSSDMLEKWSKVLAGGNGWANGRYYHFDHNAPYYPYYIASVNGVNPLAGYYFMNVDKCYHVGTFFKSTSPDPAPNTLSILDTCPACLDCPDFATVSGLIDQLLAAINLQKGKVEDAPIGTAPALEGGILDQYMSMLEHWNYVVNLKSWRYNAEARGNEIYASCKYTNHTDATIPAGIIIEINFGGAPTNSSAFFIDTAVKDIPKPVYKTDIVRVSASLVRMTLPTPLPSGAGIRFYCGSLSPDYTGNPEKGTTVRVNVGFSLTFPSGGIGNKSTGFNTNLMVVIDPDDADVWDIDASSSGP
jgi:hypothetical protein